MEGKCEVIDKKVVPCKGLASLVDCKYSDNRKGVFYLELMSGLTGETTRTGYGIRSGEHVKKGVILNFCPWCGEKIGEHF